MVELTEEFKKPAKGINLASHQTKQTNTEKTMSLEKLLAMAEGKEVIKKAFQDVKNEIMTITLIRLSGDNLGKELDKSIDEFMAAQDKTDETSQGFSKVIAAHVKKRYFMVSGK